ncbi:MAG TPA: hypothetical protein ENH91_01075 [Leeuwenhoekiella sp.]|nr:hypothetical protein [Leeuwenhoekiella sp.]
MYVKTTIILIVLACVSCQDYGKLDKKASLSRDLSEVSGIAFYKGNPTLYVIADHSNPNIIYGLNDAGEIVQQILVANAKNEDWEDLATDNKNRLFIGDFGNNDNARKDQTIYTIKDISAFKKEKDTAYATKTTFTLADQQNFPAKLDNRNFDIEAFIYKDNFFYFFTHNRDRRNFDGMSKVYKIPATAGNFKASPIASYKLCTDNINCAITSAVLSPDEKTLLLLTYNTVYKLTDFTDADFFGGNIEKFPLGHSSKKEAIAFKDSTTVFIADERRAQSGGNLYEFSLK